jgi:hypothetical protein
VLATHDAAAPRLLGHWIQKRRSRSAEADLGDLLLMRQIWLILRK